jgi:hypothetical protein
LTTRQYITEDSELQYSLIKRKENYAVAWLWRRRQGLQHVLNVA